MNVVLCLGFAGIALLSGVILRAKVRFLREMLVPAGVLGGVVGFVFMNLSGAAASHAGTFSSLVGFLFTFSFISIGLTSSAPAAAGSESGTAKNILKGSVGMAFLWLTLYCLTPVISYYALKIIGPGFGMGEVYGLLMPFAFAQGPGQAAVFGSVIESYGHENATMVALAFAAIGYLYTFLVGVPIAKYGIKKGLAKHGGKIDEKISRGYPDPDGQTLAGVKSVTYSGNVDSLAFHMAVLGLCFVIAYGLTYLQARFIPGFADTAWGMMFMNGMVAAYLVKFVASKLGLSFFFDNETQKRITGFFADFLVVCSFMAVTIGVIGAWIVPIFLVCLLTAVVTFVFCIYFGPRFGGENDFERTLGIWGVLTGTVPTGISLVRIVDPEMKTTTLVELGGMNLPMMLFVLTAAPILSFAAGGISETSGMLAILAPIPVYLIIMKLFKVWGKKTYDLFPNKPR